jgi:cellulose synthase/poly-beta-1,6-N-acetylglucosamine synthase-like glycosyltransferase
MGVAGEAAEAVFNTVGARLQGRPHVVRTVAGTAQPCRELDCVRDRLNPEALRQAEARAGRLGTGADRVLVAHGAVDEETYARALARSLGLVFEPFDALPRTACPLSDDRLAEAAATGIAPVTAEGGTVWVVAPRHLAARRLVDYIGRRPALANQFRLTTAARLDGFAQRGALATLKERAADGLRERWPLLSAAGPWRLRDARMAIAACGAFAGGYVVMPAAVPLVLEILLTLFFMAWLGLRLAAALAPRPSRLRPPARRDRDLPVYTVIAALYREARSVGDLLNAIARFHYPREKLDIILAVEADDDQTRTAIAAYAGPLRPRLIVAPDGAPRTKPKALNSALPFARGHYTVVYDAEDRPEPNQLRDAVEAFAAGDDGLACVQARLTIDNTEDGFLARMFTAEYAGQFDVFLDGLCAFNMPLPLGGSSNHFVTAVLREVGGWDAWNVTEDADLGMRLARFGYRAEMISSTTHEEAPARLGPWLRQRTRWFKGWMQTWCVHTRQPLALRRELGWRGFLAFQLVVGGNVLAALVHPVFMGILIAAALHAFPLWRADEAATALAALYGLNLVTGYASSAVLCTIGLSRRGLMRSAWVLALMPLHWLLLSAAAWRALYQLLVAPYAWEKTEHGLAKHSRRAARLAKSLLELERDVTALQAESQDRYRRLGRGRRP